VTSRVARTATLIKASACWSGFDLYEDFVPSQEGWSPGRIVAGVNWFTDYLVAFLFQEI
jgi:hypothetical protein